MTKNHKNLLVLSLLGFALAGCSLGGMPTPPASSSSKSGSSSSAASSNSSASSNKETSSSSSASSSKSSSSGSSSSSSKEVSSSESSSSARSSEASSSSSKSSSSHESDNYGTWPTVSSDKQTITYGLYPKTHVSDESLVASLNRLGSSAKGKNGWYLYGGEYYAKQTASPFYGGCLFDDGAHIVSGTAYWFHCEPIEWKVLSEDGGDYYILANVLLDAQCYFDFTSRGMTTTDTRTIGGKTVYHNNYKHSDIRAWLNGKFLESAFALGSSSILTTLVDNSASTMKYGSNEFACEDTEDKVFLPSFMDYINASYGFSLYTYDRSQFARARKTTDWARAGGATYSTDERRYFKGPYCTRSPAKNGPDTYGVTGITDYGEPDNYCSADYIYGVRPALRIHID